jgi:predicted O-methyltransferase YrrM
MFAQQINARTVVQLPEFRTTFLRSTPDNSLDFIYLDSSHDYENTKMELELCFKALKPGGVLLGDDWHDDPNHRHSGVARAVREVLETGPHTSLFQPKDCQWGVKCIK